MARASSRCRRSPARTRLARSLQTGVPSIPVVAMRAGYQTPQGVPTEAVLSGLGRGREGRVAMVVFAGLGRPLRAAGHGNKTAPFWMVVFAGLGRSLRGGGGSAAKLACLVQGASPSASRAARRRAGSAPSVTRRRIARTSPAAGPNRPSVAAAARRMPGSGSCSRHSATAEA